VQPEASISQISGSPSRPTWLPRIDEGAFWLREELHLHVPAFSLTSSIQYPWARQCSTVCHLSRIKKLSKAQARRNFDNLVSPDKLVGPQDSQATQDDRDRAFNPSSRSTASLGKASCHMLRHSFATHLLEMVRIFDTFKNYGATHLRLLLKSIRR